MIKTVKDLKEFLKDYSDDTVLLSFNQDDSLPEICKPLLCKIKERDPKNGRAQYEALSDLKDNILQRGGRDNKEVKDFVKTLKIGDNFIII